MAEVWIRSYAAALPTVRRAHTDDEVREWFASVVVPRHEAWVAVDGWRVVGLLVLVEAEIEQLYLAPEWRGSANEEHEPDIRYKWDPRSDDHAEILCARADILLNVNSSADMAWTPSFIHRKFDPQMSARTDIRSRAERRTRRP